MAKQTDQFFPVGYNNAGVNFANADGNNIKEIIAAGANDSIITSLFATSTDVNANTLLLYMYDGANEWLINAFAIPALAGSSSPSRPVDLMVDTWLPLTAGKRVITLKQGWQLRAAMVNAVAAGYAVQVVAMTQDF